MAEQAAESAGASPVSTVSAACSAICPGYQQDPQTVEDEHQDKVHLGLAGCAFKFLPGKDAPESGDHGRGLPNGVGNGYAGEAGSGQIEHHAGAPDESAEQSEGVAGDGPAQIARETHGLTDQWSPHEISVPDQTREQRTQREKDGNAVGAEGC